MTLHWPKKALSNPTAAERACSTAVATSSWETSLMAAIRNRTRIAETLIADRSAWLLTNAAKARNLHRSHEFTQGIFCRAAQEEAVPRGDKSTYTDKQERKAQHIEQSYESRGVSEKEAERRAWAPSTRTMAAESGQADRAAASRLATPPRIKGAGSAALHRPRDRRRADRQRRKRLPPHVSETPRTPPTRTGNKHDRP
jgi:hypothetical protein